MAKKNHTQSRADVARKIEEKKAKKLRRDILLCVIVGGLVTLVVLTAFLYRMSFQTDFAYQHGTAAKVNGYSLTAADYNFFFYRSYYEYLNGATDASYGIGSRPDETKALSAQTFSEQDGQVTTWWDFFASRADTLIEQTFFYYDLAQEAGYTLTQEQEDDIQYDFDEKIWFEAEELQQISVEQYLVENYGKGMTEEIYLKNLRILFTANFYIEECRNHVEISTEELDSYYDENRQDFRYVEYRLFYLSGKSGDNEKTDASMAQAKARADELAAAAHNEEEFISLCETYQQYNDEFSYWTGASDLRREENRFALTYFRQWLGDEAREPGDVQVAEAENGYYIAMFLDASDNEEESVNLLYFTISGDGAAAKGRDFLETYEESEQTPEMFFSLSEDIRDIDYTGEYRKIASISYEDATRITVPEILEGWCFDEPRQSGDTVLLTEGSSLAHVALFESYGPTASRVLAYNELSGERYRAWNEEELAQVQVEHGFFFYLNKTL